MVYLEQKLMLLSWCCLREEFRMFRPDRIQAAAPTGASFRPKRVGLLRDYIARMSASAHGQHAPTA